eukprot:9487752-Pyramimonas_sp.AAC.1
MSPVQAAWMTTGNDCADTYARRGAELHPVDSDAMTRIARSRIVVEHVGMFVAHMASKGLAKLDGLPRLP